MKPATQLMDDALFFSASTKPNMHTEEGVIASRTKRHTTAAQDMLQGTSGASCNRKWLHSEAGWQVCRAPRSCAAVTWSVVDLNGRSVKLRAAVPQFIGALWI